MEPPERPGRGRPRDAAADERRRELMARVPGSSATSRASPAPAPDKARRGVRRLPGEGPSRDGLPPVTDAYRKALARTIEALPGSASLEPPLRQALLRLVEGPVLGADVHEDRRWSVQELWTGVQKQLREELAAASRLAPERQAELLRSLLAAPRHPVTLAHEPTGHAVLALRWRPGESAPLIHYGRWALSAGRGDRGFYFVKCPDTIMRRRFMPLAEHPYAYRTYRLSLEDQRRLIEWVERAFAVNEPKADPTRSTTTPEQTFIEYALSMLNILGRPYPDNGLVEEGQRPGRTLMPEEVPHDSGG